MVQNPLILTVALIVALGTPLVSAMPPASALHSSTAPQQNNPAVLVQLKQADEGEAPSVEEGTDGVEIAPISDQELNQFASTLMQLQSIQNSYREQILAAVEAQGLSPERFDQILVRLRSPQSPEVADIPEPTPEEMEQFQLVLVEIGSIQEAIQSQMQQTIIDEGFEIERFQEIATAVNNDQALEQRVRQMMEAMPSSEG